MSAVLVAFRLPLEDTKLDIAQSSSRRFADDSTIRRQPEKSVLSTQPVSLPTVLHLSIAVLVEVSPTNEPRCYLRDLEHCRSELQSSFAFHRSLTIDRIRRRFVGERPNPFMSAKPSHHDRRALQLHRARRTSKPYKTFRLFRLSQNDHGLMNGIQARLQKS